MFEEDLCLDVSKRMRGGSIKLLNCHSLGGNQKWEYDVKVCKLKFERSSEEMTRFDQLLLFSYRL